MELGLCFTGGRISGDGIDDIGKFVIKGGYDAAKGECYWTKTYVGAHDVFYRGFREGKGIWGRWEIGVIGHGGFHVWPRGEASEEQAEAATDAEPVDAIATQEVVQPVPAVLLSNHRCVTLLTTPCPTNQTCPTAQPF